MTENNDAGCFEIRELQNCFALHAVNEWKYQVETSCKTIVQNASRKLQKIDDLRNVRAPLARQKQSGRGIQKRLHRALASSCVVAMCGIG
jgi:hypothetical protein